jgi:hypothetical protein
VTILRSNKATNWNPPRLLDDLIFYLTYPLQANPDYKSKYHLVREWLIEFEENGMPWREIGLGEDEKPIIAGPDKRNYGFWLDSNMDINDFEKNPVEEKYFEGKWNEFWKNRKYEKRT